VCFSCHAKVKITSLQSLKSCHDSKRVSREGRSRERNSRQLKSAKKYHRRNDEHYRLLRNVTIRFYIKVCLGLIPAYGLRKHIIEVLTDSFGEDHFLIEVCSTQNVSLSCTCKSYVINYRPSLASRWPFQNANTSSMRRYKLNVRPFWSFANAIVGWTRIDTQLAGIR
jgi:hypothetical protein